MNKPIDNESKNLYHKEYEKTLVWYWSYGK
jgi:hypothetical protein